MHSRPPVAECMSSDNKQIILEADSVVFCLGMKARRDLAESFNETCGEVYVIGDCAGGYSIYDAVESAWRVVLSI